MKVMILVTHLLGTGHLSRALVLARALKDAGEEVLVVSGGMAAPHLQQKDVPLVQLPAVRSDGTDFSRLLTEAGEEATPEHLKARRDLLLETLDRFDPDCLVTELFPFGRRILRDEFLALLEAARQGRQRIICASIRDILAPPTKAKKALFAEEVLARYYDAVLVHSDPEIMPLSLSWPVTETLAPMLRYTGFVAPPPAAPLDSALGAGEILVSAGGGDVGAHLFDCACAAAVRRPDMKWRLLVGGKGAAERAASYSSKAPGSLIAEPARPEFRAMLYRASASLSLCGYNTALDILQAGTPAVFVPFDAGNEVEQGIRAEALAKQPGIATLRSSDLTADRLLEALDSVRTAPKREAIEIGFSGAARSATILRQLWAEKA